MNLADRRLLLLDRKKEILKSRASLIPFARYMSPDPDNRVDALRSSYEAARHHRAIAAALEEVEVGRIKRLMISCPPRHGKTKLASMLFPPWVIGRNPRKSIVFTTYNDKFAQDIGGVVKTTMQSALCVSMWSAVTSMGDLEGFVACPLADWAAAGWAAAN